MYRMIMNWRQGNWFSAAWGAASGIKGLTNVA